MVVSEGGIINVPDDVTSADNIEFDITVADHALLKKDFEEDLLEGYDKVTLSFVPFIEKKDLIILYILLLRMDTEIQRRYYVTLSRGKISKMLYRQCTRMMILIRKDFLMQGKICCWKLKI